MVIVTIPASRFKSDPLLWPIILAGPVFRQECRTKETYSMVLAYFFGSALLFCFVFSFLFSLCVVGSPLLRDVYDDPSAYSQRYHHLQNTEFLIDVFA